MNTYRRHRFPPDIISYAVWLCYRFNLSHRDVEDLLADLGIIVTGGRSTCGVSNSAPYMPEGYNGNSVAKVINATMQNLFNLGRHLLRAEHYRYLRTGASSEWSRAVA